LLLLEEPWLNGTTADLLARMEQHASIAGNAFVRKSKGSLVVMRPDWVDIVSVEIIDGEDHAGQPKVHREVIGYLYSDGGIGIGEAVFYDVAEVAHWTPIPDPLSRWRGMSWMTPVLREINADLSMTQHRQVFFDNAATPNLLLKYQQKLTTTQLDSIKARWQARFSGPAGAGATVVLDEGADFTVVGSTFESMRFGELQAAGEARIAAAAGVPAIVAGLQAGLDAATYSNYAMAMRAFGDGTCAYLWGSACSSLAKLLTVPDGARLWYDTTAIPALREAAKDRADTMQVLASAASTLLTAGYESDSITKALTSGDLSLLVHTGMISVQLIPNDIASLKADQKTETALLKAKTAPLDPTADPIETSKP
jgi:HK97 family phage portal protein